MSNPYHPTDSRSLRTCNGIMAKPSHFSVGKRDSLSPIKRHKHIFIYHITPTRSIFLCKQYEIELSLRLEYTKSHIVTIVFVMFEIIRSKGKENWREKLKTCAYNAQNHTLNIAYIISSIVFILCGPYMIVPHKLTKIC